MVLFALMALAVAAQAQVAGPLPSENTGATGPAMRGEGVFVLKPGRYSLSASADAANYLTDMGGDDRWVYQKFERQTFSLEARRGFKPGFLPVKGLEAGLRIDARRRGAGALNGFIAGAETGMAALTKDDQFVNDDRVGEWAYTGTGESIGFDGAVLRENDGRAPLRLTDALLTMKAQLLQGGLTDRIPDVSLRLAVNVADPKGLDNDGLYAGAGLSVSQPLTRGLSLHSDLRAMKIMSARDALGLPLKAWAFGATAGIEQRLFKRSSVGVQMSHNGSPYVRTGLVSFDAARTDVTLGISHLAKIGTQKVLLQIYGREDINLSGEGGGALVPYSPPDLQMGVRAVWTPE